MTIRVYVIDDSAVVRQTLNHLLQGDPEFELSGCAPNPLIAGPVIRKRRPDVLLLDIEMPGMDGLTFLRQCMAEMPIPTVICSTLTERGSKVALDALAAGAVAVVTKPRIGLKQFLEDSRVELLRTLKAAARTRPRAALAVAEARIASAAAPRAPAMGGPVVLGSSTGGTQAIEAVLSALPGDAPGIAIVQHMPEKFTAMYAERLNGSCAMTVHEAREGDRLERGRVLIAPGGRHLQLRKAGSQYFAVVVDGPPVNRHKPSVDVLFRSVAQCAGKDAFGIILTGMGNDGAAGMKMLHDRGARTAAQSEETCVVFGMPMEAIRAGGVGEVLDISEVAGAILQFGASR